MLFYNISFCICIRVTLKNKFSNFHCPTPLMCSYCEKTKRDKIWIYYDNIYW